MNLRLQAIKRTLDDLEMFKADPDNPNDLIRIKLDLDVIRGNLELELELKKQNHLVEWERLRRLEGLLDDLHHHIMGEF